MPVYINLDQVLQAQLLFSFKYAFTMCSIVWDSKQHYTYSTATDSLALIFMSYCLCMSLLTNLFLICHALVGPILVIKHILSYLYSLGGGGVQ